MSYPLKPYDGERHCLRFCLLLFAWTHPGASLSIDVGGTIASNTTWSKANGPYIVTTSVYVADGVVLTIEPGVW